jgi:hypothetical protein
VDELVAGAAAFALLAIVYDAMAGSDKIVSGSVTSAEQLARRERCTARQINLTLSLAFLSPQLVRAAVEGRLPRGFNIERLRDLTPTGAASSNVWDWKPIPPLRPVRPKLTSTIFLPHHSSFWRR